MKKIKTQLVTILAILFIVLTPVNVSAFTFGFGTDTSDVNSELTLKDLTAAGKSLVSSKLMSNTSGEYSYNEFIKAIGSGEVTKAYMEYADYIYLFNNENTLYKVTNPNKDSIKEQLLLNNVDILTTVEFLEHLGIDDVEAQLKPDTTLTVQDWIITILLLWCVILLMRIVSTRIAVRRANAILTSKMMENRIIDNEMPPVQGDNDSIEWVDDNKVESNRRKFDDIAGLKEVKEDMKTLVDFLVNRDKYKEMGAEMPRGVLLYGPSGTGKTLLAKAVAGEAGVPFFHMSGSDFAEKYVGVGAKRVREFFELGRENAPCILFIDEIDTIACKRGNEKENGEDRKTLNALLTAMDGFDDAGEILVIGATNRLEDIDEAIIRPGRFTNKYCVPLPESYEDRYKIIQIYAKNKKFMDDVNLEQLAKMTIGCSPAEIESILNESAIIAAKNNLCAINTECIEDAFNKYIFKGHVKKDNFDRRKKEIELVAWHEAGHAVAGRLLGEEVYKVSILSSTTGAGGATFTLPKKMGLHSIKELKTQIISLYAGRCAELIYFNGNKEQVTTGASNDIERASSLIKQMVKFLGMNDEIGLLNLSVLDINDKIILEESSKVAKQLEEESLKLLENNKDLVEELAKLLLEKETLYEEDLKFIKKSNTIEVKEDT